MSIALMAEVWKLDLTPTEKLVFLALADCANDEGLAWPSIATIRRKSNVGERTVQRAIRALEQAGHLSRHEVTGKGCKYRIHPRHSDTPATKSPPPESAQTPATVAPKPSRTVNDLSNDKSKRVCVRKPAKLDQQIWDDWKRVRKKPVTPTVMSSMEREAAKLGWTVEQAITHAAENSWQGFKAAWIEKEAKNDNPKPSGRNAADLARRNLGCH